MLRKISPILFLFSLSILLVSLVLWNPYKSIQYGDFGLMQIQVDDIIQSNYKDLSIQYKGKELDPDWNYYPFTKPFLGKVNDQFYIDFPPYFPLLNSIFYKLFSINGLFFINLASTIFTFFLIWRIGLLLKLNNIWIIFSLFLYSFCTTILTYNFVFHEYPLAVYLITLSIYFGILYKIDNKNLYLLYFGFFGALSLYFRLEMIFLILSLGFSIAISNPKKFFKIFIFSSLGFIFPFLLLLYLNTKIHNHPLGLRYLLTLTENSTPSILQRIDLVIDMLFSKTRGLFYQSSFFILLPPFFFFIKNKTKEFFYLYLFILLGFFCIFISSPNHGDHRAPRYLFGFFPILTVLFCFSLQNFLLHEMNLKLKKFILVSLLVLVVFSLKSSLENFSILQKSNRAVKEFNLVIQNEFNFDSLILADYGMSLNTQSIYLNKKVFVIENSKDVISFLQKNKFKEKFLYSKAFPFRISPEKKLEMETEWKLEFEKIQFNHFHINWVQIGKNQEILFIRIHSE
jgi:hypothetical protein